MKQGMLCFGFFITALGFLVLCATPETSSLLKPSLMLATGISILLTGTRY